MKKQILVLLLAVSAMSTANAQVSKNELIYSECDDKFHEVTLNEVTGEVTVKMELNNPPDVKEIAKFKKAELKWFFHPTSIMIDEGHAYHDGHVRLSWKRGTTYIIMGDATAEGKIPPHSPPTIKDNILTVKIILTGEQIKTLRNNNGLPDINKTSGFTAGYLRFKS